jgi:hypothetical protein
LRLIFFRYRAVQGFLALLNFQLSVLSFLLELLLMLQTLHQTQEQRIVLVLKISPVSSRNLQQLLHLLSRHVAHLYDVILRHILVLSGFRNLLVGLLELFIQSLPLKFDAKRFHQRLECLRNVVLRILAT